MHAADNFCRMNNSNGFGKSTGSRKRTSGNGTGYVVRVNA
jgi:hypothetical protein